MDAELFAQLLAPTGQRLLDAVTAAGDADRIRLGERLRRDHPSALVAAAMTQVHLRRKAVGKLGADADRLYFTAEALEQATRRRVAEHRAVRLVEPGRSLVDLGCGIGSDLVAAVRAGAIATGVDRDPLRAAIARANLAALGLPGTVVTADVQQVPLDEFDVAFADPARRDAYGRVHDPRRTDPPWSYVERLLRRDACVKVGPAIGHHLVPDGVEAEWVSDGGDVVEAALWSGRFAGARRRATVLGESSTATLTDADAPDAGDPRATPIRPPARFLYEPDGAVIRAGLVTSVCAIVHGALLDPRIAYVTGDRLHATPFARAYAVLEELPVREKPLRQALRRRGIGRLTVKKRGVDVDPARLRARLDLRGDRDGTVVLTRTPHGARALLVEPVDQPTGRGRVDDPAAQPSSGTATSATPT